MKRITSIEVGALILAGTLFFGGLACVLWPRAGVIVRFTNSVHGWPGSSMERVSTTQYRAYGVLAMVFGAGVAALAVYRRPGE